MNRNEEDQKKADEMFDKFRDDLLKRDLSNTENYDKAILTLSSASLGFSLTAVKIIIPFSSAICLWLLKMGWFLLVLSVLISLAAYLVGNRAIHVQLKNARDYYKNGISDAFCRKNKFISFNSFLNISTGVTLSIAIILIVLFIGINIEQGKKTMPEDPKISTNVEIKSANIPEIESINTTIDNAQNSANIPVMEQAPNTGTTSQSSSSTGEKK